METGIFLTIKDVQRLLGCGSYKTANIEHLALRDAIGKRKISIWEYCQFEQLDYDYVWNYLRGKSGEPKPRER